MPCGLIGSLALVLLLSLGAGSAQGAAVCSASAFSCPASGTCVISGTHTIGNACVLDFGTRAIELRATITAATIGGSFEIRAGSLNMMNGKLRSSGGATDGGGDISVYVSGAFVMQGGSGPEIRTDGTGGGGSIDITAGSISIQEGRLLANGGDGPDCRDAGTVTLEASGAVLVSGMSTTISAATPGDDCDGGNVSVTGSSVDIENGIAITGGQPGAITIVAQSGDVELGDAGRLDADALGGDGGFGTDSGDITIEAEQGSIALSGPVSANGDGNAGFGGEVFLLAGESVVIDDSITVDGTGLFATGGSVSFEAGEITIAAPISANGGTQSGGGTIDMLSLGPIRLQLGGSLAVRGGIDGAGSVTLVSVDTVNLLGAIDATTSASNSSGGIVQVAACQALAAGAIDARSPSGIGGMIEIVAGAASVLPTAQLNALPCPDSACILVTLPSGVPTIAPGALLSPLAVVQLDPSLSPCCGNGVLNDGVGGLPNVGEQCDDGGTLFCDGCNAFCELEPASPCPSDGNECTRDCEPAGGCRYTKLSLQPCSDEPGGNVCTDDICWAGVCAHPPRTCDDDISCTTDSCDPESGCVATPNNSACDDGDSCSTEVCNPASGDPESGCVFTNQPDGIQCDDGSVCTSEDRCASGSCTGTGPQLNCDDGDPCTFDECMPELGCSNPEDASACPCSVPGQGNLPAGTACADGHECTEDDVCNASGQCTPGPVCPTDGDECTRGTCLLGSCLYFDDECPGTGTCVEGEPCSDGSVCTVGTCQGGVCQNEPTPCSDGDACTGEEACVELFGCWQVSYTPIGDPSCDTLLTDATSCYRIRRSNGAPTFAPELGVPVQDDFWSSSIDVRKQAALCLPANLDGSNPAAPSSEDLLEGYRIKATSGTPKFVARKNLEITNQLGTIVVNAKKPDQTFVPTTMSQGGTPSPSTPPDPDAFQCYRVTKAAGADAFLPISGVPLEDAFGTHFVTVRKPVRLCNPANLGGGDPEAPTHPEHLLCYQVIPGPPPVAEANLNLLNQFGTERVDAIQLREICVPSTVTELP